MDNRHFGNEYSQEYRIAKDIFGLKADQRTMLDDSEHYEAIMVSVRNGDLPEAAVLLTQAGII